MPLSTTNLYLRGSVLTNGLYNEMGKGVASNGYSLGQCQYGHNDYSGTASFAVAGGPGTMVKMSYWKSYDHDAMKFRFSPPVWGDYETYNDLNPSFFGVDGAGIAYNNINGSPGFPSGTWDYPGSSGRSNNYGFFDGVSSGQAYKQGTSGVMVMCGWIHPRDNASGQTTVVGNNLETYAIPAFKGYRLDITTAFKMRCIKGDGTGTASSDRRTFESSGTVAQNEWNFIVWQGVYNSTTINSTNNYFYVWNVPNGWQSGATFISGTGGNLFYDDVTWMVGGGANGNRWFDGIFGGWYVFNQSQPSATLQTLKDNTKAYYGL